MAILFKKPAKFNNQLGAPVGLYINIKSYSYTDNLDGTVSISYAKNVYSSKETRDEDATLKISDINPIQSGHTFTLPKEEVTDVFAEMYANEKEMLVEAFATGEGEKRVYPIKETDLENA